MYYSPLGGLNRPPPVEGWSMGAGHVRGVGPTTRLGPCGDVEGRGGLKHQLMPPLAFSFQKLRWHHRRGRMCALEEESMMSSSSLLPCGSTFYVRPSCKTKLFLQCPLSCFIFGVESSCLSLYFWANNLHCVACIETAQTPVMCMCSSKYKEPKQHASTCHAV